MDVIRIAHISDLHFGSEGQFKVWELLRNYLNDTVKPNLILVTGDISHTPDKKLFATAAEQLNLLRVERANPRDAYRVCAGNHDRHPLGNAPGKLASFVNWSRGAEGASSWFYDSFRDVVPTVQKPENITLEVGGNSWTLRLIGCDTSEFAEYTAMGFASAADLGGLDAAARGNPDADLVILMHHHHLLSIWELEASRQRLSDVFRPTIMLNAGTMLEALAVGHVNIVLHGHEHFRAYAKYGTVRGHHSETVVVGAGSATGNDSKEGCDYRRASFNLLELRRDRSVFLQEIRNNGLEWKAGDPIRLLDAAEIRKARFYRCTSPNSPPIARIMKCIEFRPDRSIEITQTWTDWSFEDGRWIDVTHNSSGVPSPVEIAFWWQDENVQTCRAEYVPAGRDHSYVAKVDTGRRGKKFARKVIANFGWLGGAVLTTADLEFLDRSKAGAFRHRGKEFAGIQVYNELQSLSLLVRLPEAFAPPVDAVEVFYVKGGEHNSDDYEPSQELAVRHHARGVFSLEVPYPRKNYQYLLA